MQSHKTHARYRKIASTPYSFSNIKKMEPTIDDNIGRWLERLDTTFAETGAAFDLAPWTVFLTFDVLSSVAFGAPFRFIEEGADVAGLQQGFHDGLPLFGLMCRLYPFTHWVKSTRLGARYLVANENQDTGIGVLMRFRDRLLKQRYEDIEAGVAGDKVDFMQTYVKAELS